MSEYAKTSGGGRTFNPISDLTGRNLNNDQIYEVNTQRINFMRELEAVKDRYGEYEDVPRLSSDDLEYKYWDMRTNPDVNLNRLSYKSLEAMKHKNEVEIREQKRRTLRWLGWDGYEVGTKGRDLGGKRIDEYNEEMKILTDRKNRLESALQRKAENFVKRRKK